MRYRYVCSYLIKTCLFHITNNKIISDFDAVAVIRGEMWAFKSRHFWRIHHRAESRGDPVELTAFWYGLPANVKKIDAVYERPDHRIVFFAGPYFYVLAGNSQLEQGPTPLSYLGLPDDLDHIDAAMTWGYNGKTFFFSGKPRFLFCHRTVKKFTVALKMFREINWQ